ncbi:GerW family sporulation protein [Amycolatopsis sp. CA-230715]|uniref:GerW family sporulation protein n=1 Tax=Amycolatopsis sp. CA-230715 TaxID=2745196 RepID=UPI001C0333B9|nr:GerW family sporulation protein [Amycolatopsis sp. CA-230715]QWF85246.1 hypothetical protein HUW46_08700 [Amycolatopsis sp. CA-230715]
MELWAELDRLREGTVQPRVFGEAYETASGTTIIPVSRTSGFGRSVTPVGAFVVHDGTAEWVPAVDNTRIALLGGLVGLAAAVISTLAVLRRPPWPDLSVRGLTALRENREATEQR